MGDRIKNYILKQLDKTTAWIGFIIILFQILNLHTFIFVLAVMLIFLPESEFTGWFKNWTKEIKDLDQKVHTDKK